MEISYQPGCKVTSGNIWYLLRFGDVLVPTIYNVVTLKDTRVYIVRTE